MRYYRKGEGVLATVGWLNLPEITREEYLAALNEHRAVSRWKEADDNKVADTAGTYESQK